MRMRPNATLSTPIFIPVLSLEEDSKGDGEGVGVGENGEDEE